MLNRPGSRLLSDDREFFSSSKDIISSHNLRTLSSGCVLYSFVLLFYTVITCLSDSPDLLKVMYFAFDVIHIALCIFVITTRVKRINNFCLNQVTCVVFEMSILTFFSLEGSFTSKNSSSLYMPIAILLVLLLFIHRIKYSFLLTLLYLSSFSVMSALYKEPYAAKNDSYIALATFISAIIGCGLIARMRHNEAFALKKFEKLCNIDSLTGGLNKAALDSVCRRLVADRKHQFSFVIFDLDNFKQVNDKYGHNIGDEVIRTVGTELRSCFSKDDFVGRFGGDEFIIMIDNCIGKDRVGHDVKNAIGRINDLCFSQAGLKVKCSAGIAIRTEEDDEQSIFKRADNALYKAKETGKGKYVFAD